MRSANPTAKRGKMIDICDCKLVGELAPFGEVGPRPHGRSTEARFAVRIIRLRKPRLGRHPPGHELSDLFVFRAPRSACLFLSLLLLLFSAAVAFAPVCPPPLRSLVAPQPHGKKDKTFNRRPVFITFESWEAESGIRFYRAVKTVVG